MKFSIALGLLLAGLVSGKITEAEKVKVDKFLRQNQKLSSDFKIKSFQINGQNAQVTYEKESQKISFGVQQQHGQYQIVSSQDIISLKMNTPILSLDLSGGVQGQLPSVFNMNPFEKMKMSNHLGNLEQQISKIQNMMKNKSLSFQRQMKNRKSQMQQSFLKNMKDNQIMMGGFFQTPMLLGGPHDMWQNKNIQNNHINPLIGGDGHDSWQGIVVNTPQLHMRGQGYHDLWRKNGKSQGKHHKDWKKQYEKFLKNPHQQKPKPKQNWLSNHIPKFGPLEQIVTKSIFNQGKKMVESTLQNLKDKVWNKKNKGIQKIQQTVQLPLILGGDNDPDHIPHKNVEKNDQVKQLINNIVDFIKQVKPKKLLKQQSNGKFEDLDEDQGQKEDQGKLKLLIK